MGLFQRAASCVQRAQRWYSLLQVYATALVTTVLYLKKKQVGTLFLLMRCQFLMTRTSFTKQMLYVVRVQELAVVTLYVRLIGLWTIFDY